MCPEQKGDEVEVAKASNAEVKLEEQNKAIEAKATKDRADIAHLIELAKPDGDPDPFLIIQGKAQAAAAEEDFKGLENPDQLIQHLKTQNYPENSEGIAPRKQKINENIRATANALISQTKTIKSKGVDDLKKYLENFKKLPTAMQTDEQDQDKVKAMNDILAIKISDKPSETVDQGDYVKQLIDYEEQLQKQIAACMKHVKKILTEEELKSINDLDGLQKLVKKKKMTENLPVYLETLVTKYTEKQKIFNLRAQYNVLFTPQENEKIDWI